MDAGRKRGRPDAAPNGNGAASGSKRLKESDSLQPGVGSKSKPCTKFFSTAGCPFGEGCHFMHHVPGGFSAVAQMMNLSTPAPVPSKNSMGQPGIPEGQSPAGKTRLCNKYNTAEGCKFGDKCHFAHGERELGGTSFPSHGGRVAPHLAGRLGGHSERSQPSGLAASGFGTSTIAKISVVASLAGGIIGKGGSNTKEICHKTGARLSIREHDSDTNLRNIELEGTFDQVGQASAMVKELIVQLSSANPPPPSNYSAAAAPSRQGSNSSRQGSNYKTRFCDNFAKGSCTYGASCHFAHGASELRKSAP